MYLGCTRRICGKNKIPRRCIENRPDLSKMDSFCATHTTRTILAPTTEHHIKCIDFNINIVFVFAVPLLLERGSSTVTHGYYVYIFNSVIKMEKRLVDADAISMDIHLYVYIRCQTSFPFYPYLSTHHHKVPIYLSHIIRSIKAYL